MCWLEQGRRRGDAILVEEKLKEVKECAVPRRCALRRNGSASSKTGRVSCLGSMGGVASTSEAVRVVLSQSRSKL